MAFGPVTSPKKIRATGAGKNLIGVVVTAIEKTWKRGTSLANWCAKRTHARSGPNSNMVRMLGKICLTFEGRRIGIVRCECNCCGHITDSNGEISNILRLSSHPEAERKHRSCKGPKIGPRRHFPGLGVLHERFLGYPRNLWCQIKRLTHIQK